MFAELVAKSANMWTAIVNVTCYDGSYTKLHVSVVANKRAPLERSGGATRGMEATTPTTTLRMMVQELGFPLLSILKQLVEKEGYLPAVEATDVPLTQELQLRLCMELGECYPTEGCCFKPPNTISAMMN